MTARPKRRGSTRDPLDEYRERLAEVEVPDDVVPDTESAVEAWLAVDDYLRAALAPEPDSREDRERWHIWYDATRTRASYVVRGLPWNPFEPERC